MIKRIYGGKIIIKYVFLSSSVIKLSFSNKGGIVRLDFPSMTRACNFASLNKLVDTSS